MPLVRRQSCSNRVSSVRGFTVRPLDTLVRDSPTYEPAFMYVLMDGFSKLFLRSRLLSFSFLLFLLVARRRQNDNSNERAHGTIEISNAFGLARKSTADDFSQNSWSRPFIYTVAVSALVFLSSILPLRGVIIILLYLWNLRGKFKRRVSDNS